HADRAAGGRRGELHAWPRPADARIHRELRALTTPARRIETRVRAGVLRAMGALALVAAVSCLPSGPRGGSARNPAVRVALGVAAAADMPRQLTPRGGALVEFKGKRYRGILRSVSTDSGT